MAARGLFFSKNTHLRTLAGGTLSATEASSKEITCELDRILNGESIESEVSLV